MAKTKGVWGIDIGQSALKAMRCHADDDGNIIADSFDFIEYPKALSLPDADEETLVSEALDTFLSRNDVRGDFVAMTVSGQSGLSRFFKPPPVDARTLPDIVKYEVRQQIPFPIEDVIWDWQSLGGTEMDNVLVDAEVGLFAIKRDTVYTALQPFLKKDIEVDLIQLSPLASNNIVCREMLPDLPEDEELDMDSLPDSLVILSMGTDATDLIVTNGVKLWLRNIPIGGNHFTKELSRELKLTHAKAEHLKRNARQAEDPKTVFQAMRRVFNDLKKEIDRSLSYYSGMDKNAALDRIVLLGNAARLPGLRQYLNKQLEMDIAKIPSFDRLQGPVTDERVFKENLLSFAPVYGLCLQGLKQARVDTNLLPVEFINERIIRAKKPWVLASVSLLMLGMLFSYFFVNQRWWGVNDNYTRDGVSWKQAKDQVESKARVSALFKGDDEEQTTLLNRINAISAELSEASETQAAWPELLSAIDQLLPRDPRMLNADGTLSLVVDPDKIPFVDREEIYIDHIETKFYDDVTPWLNTTINAYRFQQGEITEVVQSRRPGAKVTEYELSGPGFVVELKGHHFFNSQAKVLLSQHGSDFVTNRLLVELIHGKVQLLNADGQLEEYTPLDIGVFNPTLVQESKVYPVQVENPNFGREGRDKAEDTSDQDANDDRTSDGDSTSTAESEEVPQFFEVPKYDFTIQMIFMPVSPAERDEARAQRLLEEQQEAAEAGGDNNQGSGTRGRSGRSSQKKPDENQDAPANGDSEEQGDTTTTGDPDADATDSGDTASDDTNSGDRTKTAEDSKTGDDSTNPSDPTPGS